MLKIEFGPDLERMETEKLREKKNCGKGKGTSLKTSHSPHPALASARRICSTAFYVDRAKIGCCIPSPCLRPVAFRRWPRLTLQRPLDGVRCPRMLCTFRTQQARKGTRDNSRRRCVFIQHDSLSRNRARRGGGGAGWGLGVKPKKMTARAVRILDYRNIRSDQQANHNRSIQRDRHVQTCLQPFAQRSAHPSTPLIH